MACRSQNVSTASCGRGSVTSRTIRAGVLWVACLASSPLPGAQVNADPSNYRDLLSSLKAGDTLHLAPGKYSRLPVTGLQGTAAAWIAITGPASGPPAVILGSSGYNTVEILNCSYVAIENLRIDSRGIPGAFGISAQGGAQNLTHDIRIENNVLVGQNGGQQTDGISTKTPTWGWIIRGNQIVGAGTGLYLGNSDATQPFVAGLIENNLIQDTIGYNMQIKDQLDIPAIPGMPTGPASTIVRNNLFIKNDRLSPDGDRPNVLLGAFPATGPGSLNMYEVYGNYFVHNHREALFQASGRITVHDNFFVDGPYTYPAVVLRNQNYALKIAYVYNNTVYTSGRGIYFGSRALVDDAVVGNLVFALTPISGAILHQSNNVTVDVESASKYVRSPSFELGSMDFYPLTGKCQGAAIDLSLFRKGTDYTVDFNGTPKTRAKGAVVFRGAYAGEGTNPGWQAQVEGKPPHRPLENPAATLAWISPAGGQAGKVIPVTLIGSNFTAGATVTASGAGVTIHDVTVVSPTEITAVLTIAANAAAGPRAITVDTPAGASDGLTFRVTARPRQPASKPER